MGFESLLGEIRRVMEDHEIRSIVRSRIKSFESMLRKPDKEIFKEVAFCILAANFSASRSMKIIEALGDRLLELDSEELALELRRLGHRYPRLRAKYIVKARKRLREMVKSIQAADDEFQLRGWLVRNIKGLGFKEASHLLRNLGCKNLAIIDLHILRILRRYGLISELKSLTRRRYLEIEKLLRRMAKELGITLAELDLYLWYMDSGKILK